MMQAEAIPRLLLTGRETAEALGVSERSLYRMTAPRGELVATKLGNRTLRYHVDDIRKFVESRRVTA